MSETGMALMGTGTASGESRAVEAAQKAISSPLLEDISIEGARGLLINITGGHNMTLSEIHEATTLIQKEAHEDANIIWGMVFDEKMHEEIRFTVIATGFGRAEEKMMSKAAAGKGKVEPISFRIREGLRENSKENPRESLKDIFKESVKENAKENNRDIPTFMRKATKTRERFDELKLVETPDFSMEDDDRFDIPTFLRKQAD
jgi:cell division protein FtsZ